MQRIYEKLISLYSSLKDSMILLLLLAVTILLLISIFQGNANDTVRTFANVVTALVAIFGFYIAKKNLDYKREEHEAGQILFFFKEKATDTNIYTFTIKNRAEYPFTIEGFKLDDRLSGLYDAKFDLIIDLKKPLKWRKKEGSFKINLQKENNSSRVKSHNIDPGAMADVIIKNIVTSKSYSLTEAQIIEEIKIILRPSFRHRKDSITYNLVIPQHIYKENYEGYY